MASGSYPNRGGGIKVTGAGWLVLVLIVVVAGMMLMAKKNPPADPVAEGPASSIPADRTSGSMRPSPQRPQTQTTPTKTKAGEWSIEEVDGTPSTPEPVAAKARKTKKGEWTIEEVDTNEPPSAQLDLRTSGTPVGGAPKTTKKGDWKIEVD